MMKSTLLNSLILAALIVPGLGYAETTTMPDKASIPTFGAVMGASGFDISGYVDATYTNLSGTGKFPNGFNNRVFDFEPNSFNLQAIDVTVSKLPSDGFGGLVNATLGKDADTIAAYGTIDPT